MVPSLKKDAAVSKTTEAACNPPVLSPKTKACHLKAPKTSLSCSMKANNMAIDPINNGSCIIEIDSNDGAGTDDDNDKKQLDALPVVFPGPVQSGFLSRLGGNHNCDWFFLHQDQRDCNWT